MIMKISAIVTVFNIERYILKCLESLHRQGYENYEVVIVNDGSTDRSRELITDFIQNKPAFRMIDKLNGGLGSARNEGLKFVTGQYVTFIDGDDYLPNDAFQKAVHEIETEENQPDILCGGVIYVDGRGEHLEKSILKSHTSSNYICKPDEAISKVLSSRDITPFVADKFFRLDFFKDEGIRFSDNRFYEDIMALIPVMKGSQYIKVISYPLYYYYQRTGSISNSFGEKHIKDRAFATKFVYSYLLGYSLPPDLKSALDNTISGCTYFILYNLFRARLDDRTYQRLYRVFDSSWKELGLPNMPGAIPDAGFYQKLFFFYARIGFASRLWINNFVFKIQGKSNR